MSHHFSKRGNFLLTGGIGRPLLTVEACGKWYELYLILPNGDVETVSFIELEPYVDHTRTCASAYVDHVPNPTVVETFAEAKGYIVDEVALDLISGRWAREVMP